MKIEFEEYSTIEDIFLYLIATEYIVPKETPHPKAHVHSYEQYEALRINPAGHASRIESLYRGKDVYAIDYCTVVIKVQVDMINRAYLTVNLQF